VVTVWRNSALFSTAFVLAGCATTSHARLGVVVCDEVPEEGYGP